MSKMEIVVGEVVGMFHEAMGKDGWCEALENAVPVIMDGLDIDDEEEAEEILKKIMDDNGI